jgi:PBP1b-binding outer membrane lipoprotein LpoB
MNKSILLAYLLAAVALTACSKKEEPKVEAPAAVVTPAPAPEAASAAASAAVDAAASAVDAASAASK